MLLRLFEFQSTFPQGERQAFIDSFVYFFLVSIHVPARGTTEREILDAEYLKVSIHVPAKGTTVIRLVHLCDIYVSIHVPAKGTTPKSAAP